MKTNCQYTELVDTHKLVPNPRNTNQHPQRQIEVLAKLIDFQGWRHPVIVSKRSGFVVAGHGRLEAAKKLGLEKVPVDYQDFENEAQEYAFLESDNHIAKYAEFDQEKMLQNLQDFANTLDEYDFESLGLIDFNLLGDLPPINGASQMDKLAKYLEKDFHQIKLEYNESDYDAVVAALENYRAQNGNKTYSQIIYEVLGLDGNQT